MHFDIGREKSINALEKAMVNNQYIFLSSQKDENTDLPTPEDFYQIGTIGKIKQMLKLPGDSIRVLVEGRQRAILQAITQESPYWEADVAVPYQEIPETPEILAMVRTTHDLFDSYARASMRVSGETLRSVSEVDKPDQLADIIAANVLTRVEDRQAILEEIDVERRLEALCAILVRETELAGIEKQVQGRLKKQIDKNQKDYYLREQINRGLPFLRGHCVVRRGEPQLIAPRPETQADDIRLVHLSFVLLVTHRRVAAYNMYVPAAVTGAPLCSS